MQFDNSFEVPLSPPQAWAVLMDIPRIAPCMPGAELTEVVDSRNYKGKIAVRLGPVALTFAGRVEFESIDEVDRSARVKAQGNDAKGRGSATAAATFRIEPAGGGSKVMIHTDLMLSGAVAQYGRGVGMIQATASQIIGQFAANLRAQLAPGPPLPSASPAAVPSAADRPDAQSTLATAPSTAGRLPAPLQPTRPIPGLSLLARVIWQQIVSLFTGRRS